ncbi:hypothetical protein HID58_070251 [Brassica napus]|uniref:Uncharacterized protein n=1 Tax=Brassica napus TaxID=3708 RepID=A0ABQ7YY86_BRANA|nr:hypothetical protein HID58_070251 [Brassica napus]
MCYDGRKPPSLRLCFLVVIFNDKELELLISGLPEIDFDDLTANTPSTPATRQDPMLFIGSFRRFQGTTRYFWPSEITNPQRIWSSRAAAISSYMLR